MNLEQQGFELVNVYRRSRGLPPMRYDHRLTRGARYWQALCLGRKAWLTEFSDIQPWNAIRTAPMTYQVAWLIVASTSPTIAASVQTWFTENDLKDIDALHKMTHIGLVLHQERHQWHWIIYTAIPLQPRKTWWG